MKIKAAAMRGAEKQDEEEEGLWRCSRCNTQTADNFIACRECKKERHLLSEKGSDNQHRTRKRMRGKHPEKNTGQIGTEKIREWSEEKMKASKIIARAEIILNLKNKERIKEMTKPSVQDSMASKGTR